MKVDLGIWDKLTRVILGLLFLAAFGGVILWYRPLVYQNEQWRKRTLELDKEIRQELRTQDRLKAAITSMQDRRTVERLAREKLGYARTGEWVIRFEAPLTNLISSGASNR
jgi:cell division protein FtsB